MTIILGPSGASKSTLLRCLSRLVEPAYGQIELNGKDIAHFSGGFRLQEVAVILFHLIQETETVA